MIQYGLRYLNQDRAEWRVVIMCKLTIGLHLRDHSIVISSFGTVLCGFS
jgi:hypothetical protein